MIDGTCRELCDEGAGPMHTDSSASLTYLASRSASEYTATVLMPISRQARWMRRAISPRFAIRIFSNILCSRGKIALTACGRCAFWLRRCAALRQLVAAVGDEDFF